MRNIKTYEGFNYEFNNKKVKKYHLYTQTHQV